MQKPDCLGTLFECILLTGQLATLLFTNLYVFGVTGRSAWAMNANKKSTCNKIQAREQLSGFLQSFSNLFIFILHIHQAITSAFGWRGWGRLLQHTQSSMIKQVQYHAHANIRSPTQTSFTPIVKSSTAPENHVSWPQFVSNTFTHFFRYSSYRPRRIRKKRVKNLNVSPN